MANNDPRKPQKPRKASKRQPPRGKDTRRRHWVIPVITVLGVGAALYYCSKRLPPYPILTLAALIHLSEEAIPRLAGRIRTARRIVEKARGLRSLSLAIPFALYAYVAMLSFQNYTLLAVLMLGGVAGVGSRAVKRVPNVSFVSARAILACSLFTVSIPNVLLMEAETARAEADKHKFLFAGMDTGCDETVVVDQNPSHRGGIFGTRWRLGFRIPHTVLWPGAWPPLECEVEKIPTIRITQTRQGHGDNDNKPVPVEEREGRAVGQNTRICGTFSNLPRGSKRLFIRVLIRPSISVGPVFDEFIQLWCAQPHEPYSPDNRFKDVAELNVQYDQGSSTKGRWWVDGFFGAPQNVGGPFEIRAMITSRDFKRGEIYTDGELENIRGRLSDRVREATEATLQVHRRGWDD